MDLSWPNTVGSGMTRCPATWSSEPSAKNTVSANAATRKRPPGVRRRRRANQTTITGQEREPEEDAPFSVSLPWKWFAMLCAHQDPEASRCVGMKKFSRSAT